MIGEGNDEGNAVVQKVVDKLLDQTKSIERAVATLDLSTIKFEGSDSLDDPNKVIEENKSAGAAPAASPQEVRSAAVGPGIGHRDGSMML